MADHVDLTISVRIGGFSRATDLVNEVRALLEREGWDPDKTLQWAAYAPPPPTGIDRAKNWPGRAGAALGNSPTQPFRDEAAPRDGDASGSTDVAEAGR